MVSVHRAHCRLRSPGVCGCVRLANDEESSPDIVLLCREPQCPHWLFLACQGPWLPTVNDPGVSLSDRHCLCLHWYRSSSVTPGLWAKPFCSLLGWHGLFKSPGGTLGFSSFYASLISLPVSARVIYVVPDSRISFLWLSSIPPHIFSLSIYQVDFVSWPLWIVFQ